MKIVVLRVNSCVVIRVFSGIEPTRQVKELILTKKKAKQLSDDIINIVKDK